MANSKFTVAPRIAAVIGKRQLGFKNTEMKYNNFFTITIPKGRRVNFKMLAKVYGSLQTYDYSNSAVAATCRVYLSWGIN